MTAPEIHLMHSHRSDPDAVFASLVGSAVGDALGLPYENLSARRGARLLGPPTRFRLLPGDRGMVSDDAEHACMTAAAYAASGGDVDRFRRNLARRLRWWMLTIPCGIGLATLKSIGKLWVGWPPARSGVRSAGNGPAMRAAVLGRLCAPDRLFDFIAASTHLTHRDPRATLGAYAVAIASRACANASHADTPGQSAASPRIEEDDRRSEPGRREYALPRRAGASGIASIDDVRNVIRGRSEGEAATLLALLDRVADSLSRGESTETFAAAICRKPGRVSGYIYETVPVALHAAFAHADPLESIRAAIRCGGDTDSVASIVGGIRGLADATSLARLIEFGCDAAWLRRLAESGASGASPPRLPWASRLPRNALQLAFVLAHVARRALPPY